MYACTHFQLMSASKNFSSITSYTSTLYAIYNPLYAYVHRHPLRLPPSTHPPSSPPTIRQTLSPHHHLTLIPTSLHTPLPFFLPSYLPTTTHPHSSHRPSPPDVRRPTPGPERVSFHTYVAHVGQAGRMFAVWCLGSGWDEASERAGGRAVEWVGIGCVVYVHTW